MPSRLDPDAIRARMNDLNIHSLASLSCKSGVSQATIDRIMHHRSGNCNSQTVQLLADALKCSPFDLYTAEALTEGTAMATAVAVADAVAEAVNEAVNAVVSEVAPDAPPQEVASAIPAIEVTPPPALDLAEYFDYLKSVHTRELESLHASYKRHLIALYAGIGSLVIALLLAIIW